MRKTKVKTGIVTLVILAIAVYLIAGTYARYSSTGGATLNGEVAKWSVAMRTDGNDMVTNTQDIVFKVTNNENVATNKIAPGVTATATVELDLTGTEVAVDFDATIAEGALTAQNLGLSYDKLALSTKLGNSVLASGIPQLIELENNSAFTAQNGIKTVTLQLKWDNDDLNNNDDTAVGIADQNLVIPVTFTAKQHLASDVIYQTVGGDRTLEEVASTMGEGQTVALSQNMNYVITTEKGYKFFEFPDNTTLDLNGATITTDMSAVKDGNVNYMGNNLTIKNGTFEATPDKGGRDYMQVWGWDGADYDQLMTNVTLENINAIGGINLYNAQNVVLKNVTATAHKYYAIFANPDAVTVTIESGTYSTTSGSTALFAYYKTNPENGFKIYGGTFNTNGKPLFLGGTNYKGGVIYGGTFDCDVSAYLADGYECVADSTNPGHYIVREQ